MIVALVMRYKYKKDHGPGGGVSGGSVRSNAAGGGGGGGGNLLPCTSCQLIEMGEMACMGDSCPKCGRVVNR